MPRKTDSRQRMLAGAARLFRRQGYAATGWRQVVLESDAPWGSQAHHFPGGKEQLAAEALTRAGGRYRDLLAAALATQHPADMVAAWATVAAGELEASGWADGCPIATVALETVHESATLAAACDGAFQSWVDVITDAAVAHGGDAEDGRALATLVVAAVEGALLLARAARSPTPLLTVGRELSAVLRDRVPSSV